MVYGISWCASIILGFFWLSTHKKFLIPERYPSIQEYDGIIISMGSYASKTAPIPQPFRPRNTKVVLEWV